MTLEGDASPSRLTNVSSADMELDQLRTMGFCICGIAYENEVHDIKVWIGELCRGAPNMGREPEEILVGIFSGRARRPNRKNSGFAYVRCASSREADAGADLFNGLWSPFGSPGKEQLMGNRQTRTSREIEILHKFIFPKEEPKKIVPDAAKQQKLEERRKSLVRQRQRKAALLRAEQEEILLRLITKSEASMSAAHDAKWSKYYSTWTHPQQVESTIAAIDWLEMPESCDPARGGGLKTDKNLRSKRKHQQVESFLALLHASGVADRAGTKIVDFGSGSGNLTLPLAYLFPECQFVAVDMKPVAIKLLNERAHEAGLTNVIGKCCSAEAFDDAFDVCIALHVCGSGTDVSMIKAVKQNASYFVSPCCIGALQVSAGIANNSCDHDSAGGLQLVHPRSRWMQSAVHVDEFMKLAVAADFSGGGGSAVSGYDTLSVEGIIPRFAKAALEADRNAASREYGYCTRLMKILHPQACVRNDMLVGFPGGEDLLSLHINHPDAEWGDAE